MKKTTSSIVLGTDFMLNQSESQLSYQPHPIQQSHNYQVDSNQQHIHLGDYNHSNNPGFYSTNKRIAQSSKQLFNFQKASLPEKALQTLKTHHFKLGTQENNNQSTSQLYYTKQPISLVNDVSHDQKQKMIAHNHKFAEYKSTDMQSHYNEQYQAKNNQVIPSNKLESLRQSSIILGQQFPEIKSFQHEVHNYKGLNTIKPQKIIANQSTLLLGNQQTDYLTSNQQFLVDPKQSQPQVADFPHLKQANVHLGQSKTDYTKSSQTQIANISHLIYSNQIKNKQNTNFQMSHNNPLNYKSEYSANMLEQPKVKQEHQIVENSSHVSFGSWKNDFKTTSQDYIQQKPDQFKLVQNINKNQNIDNGQFKKNDFVSTQKLSYNYSEIPIKKKDLNREDPRSHHFQFGQAQTDYMTSSKII